MPGSGWTPLQVIFTKSNILLRSTDLTAASVISFETRGVVSEESRGPNIPLSDDGVAGNSDVLGRLCSRNPVSSVHSDTVSKSSQSEIRMTPGKNAWSIWVETRKDPNNPWYELSGLSPREGSTQPKSRTKCIKRCGWSNGHFGPHPRPSSLQRGLSANASFADLKVWRNRDTVS